MFVHSICLSENIVFKLSFKNFRGIIGKNRNCYYNFYYKSLQMKEENNKISLEFLKYQKYLPRSFVSDRSAPFLGSFLWLQKIGRTELIRNFKNSKKSFESKFKYKEDPIFKISKKNQKQKDRKKMPKLSIGKLVEEKIIMYDYAGFKKKKFFIDSKRIQGEKKEKFQKKFYFTYKFIKIGQRNFFKFKRYNLSVFFLIVSFISKEFFLKKLD